MHSLMYLMDRLETAEAVAGDLRDMNIGHDAYHLFSKDEDGVRRHHLHGSNALERTDFIHSGERGALLGGLLGIFFALGLLLSHVFGEAMGWTGFLFAAAIIGFFGAWVGGMVGISHENYKLQPFHRAIEEGKYLMAIGVRSHEKADEVKQAMHRLHPEAAFVADDESLTDPFSDIPEFRVRHVQ